MSEEAVFEIDWFDCDGGLETGDGEPGKRRWFFEDREGGWVLRDRRAWTREGGEIVGGPWAHDGIAAHTRESARHEAQKMINARASW